MGRKMNGEIKEWVTKEFETLKLKSSRLERRFKMVMSDLWEQPEKSIWLASGSRSNAKAVYRMIGNEKCEKESIMSAHREAVNSRNEDSILLAIQDTMSVNYSGHEKTEGMGYNCEKKTLGILSHNCILVTPIGVPIGLLAQSVSTRAEKSEKSRHEKQMRKIEEKESSRWLETMKTASMNAPAGAKLIHIADREGDIYELYALADRVGESFVIRATHDRIDTESAHIVDVVKNSAVIGKVKAVIGANHKTKSKEREVAFEIRYKSFKVKKAKKLYREKDLPPFLELNLIGVIEENAPDGIEPIEWLLMTNLELDTIEDAVRVIDFYRQRWKIERFHFVLKSGCEIEKIQQRSIDGIELVLLMYSIIAIHIMMLTYTARTAPDTPCDLIFTDDEWKTLYRAANYTREAPNQPYSIALAVRYIAKLGGFVGAKSDGEPGLKVIWIGLNKLFILIAYREWV
jgi:hypothetical protein